MMPGVVAGFPWKKPGNEFYVVASVSGDSARFRVWGEYEGSITPAYKNIQVGAPSVSGAMGEIVDLWHNTNAYQLTLGLRGSYASLAAIPFTQLVIGSTVLNKSAHFNWDVTDVGYPVTRVVWNLAPPFVLKVTPVHVLIIP